MRTARDEYDRLVSRELINRVLRTIPPPSADYCLAPGDFAYAYREKVKQYTGPHVVASIDGKQVRLHVGEKTGPREFNLSQVRPAPLARIQSMDEMITADQADSQRILYTEVISLSVDTLSLSPSRLYCIPTFFISEEIIPNRSIQSWRLAECKTKLEVA